MWNSATAELVFSLSKAENIKEKKFTDLSTRSQWQQLRSLNLSALVMHVAGIQR